MKQIQVNSFGQPSAVAKCVEVADVGAPAAWEVVVDIHAFPINAADLAMMAGRYGTLPKLPSTIGMEAVGVVSAVGKTVRHLAVGDRVVLLANNNWSERRKVPATTVHKVPEDISMLQLAMLKVNPGTAFLLLTHLGKLSPGDWVLQSAPLGTVGECVIQMAKSRGIRTVNLVRDQEEKCRVLMAGGDAAVELGPEIRARVKKAIGRDVLTTAFDAVGGDGVAQIAECLCENGTIINYGMLSGEPCVIAPEQVIFRGISLVGFWLSKVLNRLTYEDRTAMFDSVCEMVQTGTLRMSVDSCYRIEDIEAALQKAERPGRRGKVMVTCQRQQ